MPPRVLHVAAEAFPHVKTGGLADVAGALPPALARAGADVRLLVPGLPAFANALQHRRIVCETGPAFGAARVTLLLGTLPDIAVPAYVVDAPLLYRRGGGPYQDARGHDWPDNLQRFALLGWAGAQLGAGQLDADWLPQVLHAHDWHAAMACAYLHAHPADTHAATVFTVHNLAYQGLFAHGEFSLLGLPHRYMAPSGLEYHGQLSFMKAGLKFANRITTVSPTYAHEITTPEYGAGLDGVIRSRAADVSGILNGVDPQVWNPEQDAALAQPYNAEHLSGKRECKAAVQRELGLAIEPDTPLFTVISRLTAQKGLDLLLAALPRLVAHGTQWAVVGTGDAALQMELLQARQAHPGRVAVRIAYDEQLAHRLVAAADAIVVPSRFEPCGLTQLYGLRYGTLPIVRRVGGLADTVVDASPKHLDDGTATGFVFDAATPAALEHAVERAIALYRYPQAWQRTMKHAMAQDFSWDHAALDYMALYRGLIAARSAA